MVTVRLELNAQRALPSSGLGPMKVIYDFKNVDWHKINKDLMNAPLLQAIQGTQDVECALAVWESIVPTCHVMVSMALTNQRRSSQGRKTAYGNERAVDLSTARLSGAVDKSKARSQNIKG